MGNCYRYDRCVKNELDLASFFRSSSVNDTLLKSDARQVLRWPRWEAQRGASSKFGLSHVSSMRSLISRDAPRLSSLRMLRQRACMYMHSFRYSLCALSVDIHFSLLMEDYQRFLIFRAVRLRYLVIIKHKVNASIREEKYELPRKHRDGRND